MEGGAISAQIGHAGPVGQRRITGARPLADAGFDAVEVHMGHHYLLNSFLSPKFNRRTDGWGGSTANRARLPRSVAQAVRDAGLRLVRPGLGH